MRRSMEQAEIGSASTPAAASARATATSLAPRGSPGAMLEDAALAAERAVSMVENGYVLALSGARVAVSPDTLCLHGDTPGAVAMAR